MMMLKSKGLTKKANNVNNSQKAIDLIHCYKEIIKTYKNSIGYPGKQGELLQKFKDTGNFFDVTQNRSQYILKFCFIRFVRNTLCLKHTTDCMFLSCHVHVSE